MADRELKHWGIKGQKWGLRRYQNKDGSLTPAGKIRYAEEYESDRKTDNVSVEESVKRAINSGNIDEVTKWRKDMTNEQLKKALERVDLEKKVLDRNSDFVNRSGTTMGTKKIARSMTDKELDVELARLKKEKEYVEVATALNARGKSEVRKALTKVGTDLTVKYASKAAGGLADASIKKLASKNATLDRWFRILKWT